MLFLQSELLRNLGVIHGFSVRTGGVSVGPYDSLNLGGSVGDDPAAVEHNRRTLCDAAGVKDDALTTVNQVHGDRVVFVRRGDAGVTVSDSPSSLPLDGRIDADAIIAAPGLAAGVRTADCVPILLYDPESGAAAAVHAGWKGTIQAVVRRTVERLASDFDVEAQRLTAAIGPAIGPCCFEVAQDLADRFASSFGPGVVNIAGAKRTPHVDLVESNRQLLVEAGLTLNHIDSLRRCTSCERDLFFSHRRDNGTTGRHLSFILGGWR